ncbi:MAG: hypothetical protein K6T90_19005 [Leptolyngbyaceae cyanobacterium HOT.MB2.61]|nr:hypothetical protein [Leptolyngbyaceae cyanobacterium HOT.MB2.61]
MDADEALVILENILREERLSQLQITIFRDTWNDLSYRVIARNSGYEVGYVKQTGSQLWQTLSKALGERVSKSNIQSVLKRYAHRNRNQLVEGARGQELGAGDWGLGTRGQELEARNQRSGANSECKTQRSYCQIWCMKKN